MMRNYSIIVLIRAKGCEAMKITLIEKNKKNPNTYMVYLDDGSVFSIPEEVYLKQGFYEKEEISNEEIIYIKEQIIYTTVKQKAMRYLTLKYRSEKEVKQKLMRDAFDEDIIESAISELKSIGYINDLIFTQKYIYDRSKLKPKSKRMLKYELLNKGVDESIIDSVLDSWEVDDMTVAIGLVKKKFGKYNLKDEKIYKKAFAFLRHRGFETNVIIDVLKQFTD